jgi:hypothetical protein
MLVNHLIYKSMAIEAKIFYNIKKEVVKYWNNSPRIDTSLHSDTLSWFRATQSVLFLFDAARLVDRQQIPIS